MKFINLKLLLLIIIIAIASFTYSRNLSKENFQQDEYQVIEAAEGMRKAGNFYKWDFRLNKSGEFTDCINSDPHCNYNRAIPHTLLVTSSFILHGGVSESSARMPSVILGVSFSLISFYFIYNLYKIYIKYSQSFILTSSAIGSLLLILSPIHKDIFGTTRMYALVLPLFLLQVLFFIKFTGIDKNKKNRNFSKKYFLVFLLLSMLNLITHINSGLIAIGIYTFALSKIKFKENDKNLNLFYRAVSIIGSIGIIMIIIFKLIGFDLDLLDQITLLKQPNWQYLYYFVEYPFENIFIQTLTGICLIIIILINLLTGLNLNIIKKIDKLTNGTTFFITNVVITATIFLIFFANRYSTYFYISFVIPLGFILIYDFFYRIFSILIRRSSINTIILTIILIIILVAQFAATINYSRKYQAFILADYNFTYNFAIEALGKDLDKSALLIQLPRKFYLESASQIELVDIGKEGSFTINDFTEIQSKYPKGFIIWANEKEEEHINTELKEYLYNNYLRVDLKDSGMTIYKF
ncbi:MAG: hypothetical protein Q9M76_02510 [Candidatus Dojkabacteria bacterium]|nr:hypothetical protein [Candidatus Dojkabacteria bacterium]